MTKKAAVILAPGCEEIEALSVVDVLRRLNVKWVCLKRKLTVITAFS